MKQFKNLYFRFPAGRADEFFKAVEAALPIGWRRDRESESRAGEISLPDQEFYYYACDKNPEHEAAMVAIYRKSAQNYEVTNVVPQELRELTYQQYNAILAGFHQQVLLRVQTDVPVTFVLGSDNLHVEDLMPPEIFRYLKAFSAGANRSTGTAHPMDQERWFAFIVGLHRSGKAKEFDATTLQRWFVEVAKWHPEMASGLAIEYEKAMALLDYTAQH